MSLRRRVSVALLAAGILAGVLGGSASAIVGVKFTIYPGSSCVYFNGATATAYTITLLDGTDVVEKLSVTTDGTGYGYGCGSVDVSSGMKVKADTTGYTRTITVPPFGGRSDRATDVIAGAGPAGKTVTVTVYRLATGTYAAGPTIIKNLSVSASGTWSVDVTADGGIRGGDLIYVGHTTAGNDSIQTSFYAEYVRVDRGASKVYGVIDAGPSIQVELRTSAGSPRGRAYLTATDYSGDAYGYLRTSAGSTVYPRTGDKVVAAIAPDATFTVPGVTIAAVASTDVVTLTCPGMASQGAYISVRKNDYSDSTYRYGVTNGSGVATFDVTTDINLVNGDSIYGRCRFDSGDEVGRWGRVGS